MEKSTTSKFTKRIIGYHASFEWYEYCPNDESEFRQIVQAIILSGIGQKNPLRISAVNMLIEEFDLDTQPLSVNSGIQNWVDIYWLLYCKDYAAIGYTTKRRLGPRILLTQNKGKIIMQ